MTSSLTVFDAAIRVKSTHLIKSCLKPEKKENVEIKDIFYIHLHLKDRLDIEFTTCKSELMPEEVLTSFTVFDAYRSLVCGSGIVLSLIHI